MISESSKNKQFEKFSNEELFCLYRNTKRLDVKQELALRYLYVIKSIVIQMRNVYIGFEQTEDMINEGVIVLMGCIDKYQPDKNATFETFISKRIRGMVIDIARKQDWVPRGIRKIYNDINNFMHLYYIENGKDPSADEIIKELGITKEKYNEVMSKSGLFSILSLDMAIEQTQENGVGIQIPSEEIDSHPSENLEIKELKGVLVHGIKLLKEKEQLVVSLYYVDEVNMKDIAKILEVSEARVSQIHSQALKKLKEHIIKNT